MSENHDQRIDQKNAEVALALDRMDQTKEEFKAATIDFAANWYREKVEGAVLH